MSGPGTDGSARSSTAAIGCTSRVVDVRNASSASCSAPTGVARLADLDAQLAGELQHQRARDPEQAARRTRRRDRHAVAHHEHVGAGGLAQLEIAESTWHRWLAQYGGMKANDAKRLKELESENTRLTTSLTSTPASYESLRARLASNGGVRSLARSRSRLGSDDSGRLWKIVLCAGARSDSGLPLV